MFTEVSERTIEVLRGSLPAVIANRSAIIGGMAASLAAADPAKDEWRLSRIATSLVDALIREAGNLVSGDGPDDGDATLVEHERLGVGRFHQSRFGDALAAVMVDAAGTSLPRTVGGAWGDTFWAMIRRMEAAGQPGAAFRPNEPQSARIPGGARQMSMA